MGNETKPPECEIARRGIPANSNLSLCFCLVALTVSADQTGDKNGDKNHSAKTKAHREAIIAYLTVHVSAQTAELAELLDLKPSRVREILAQMVDEDIITPEGNNKYRTYRLKS